MNKLPRKTQIAMHDSATENYSQKNNRVMV